MTNREDSPLNGPLLREETCLMNIFVETLTGTRFHLRAFSSETVARVKEKIQILEGIPAVQQHLIWNNAELQDDFRLRDYEISEGCTLKLVLDMRAGPINIRRVPTENPIRELTELMDSVPEDVQEKLSSNKPFAFLVYRDEDQVNFVPVVDETNGTLTPLSDSQSGGSTSNLYAEDEEETEVSPSADQIIDNSITRIRMKLLKSKMESMALMKKLRRSSVLKPRPPMAPRQSNGSVVAGRQKLLRVLPHIDLPPENLHTSKSSNNALSTRISPSRTAPAITIDELKKETLKSSIELEKPQLSINPVLPQIATLPKKDMVTKGSESALHSDLNLLCSEETSRSGGECFALLTDVRPAEQYEELCGLGNVKSEFELAEEDKQSSTIETSKPSVSSALNPDSMETGVLNATDVSPLRNNFLSPIHFYTSINDSIVPKTPRQPRCFDLGNLRPPASRNLFNFLQLRRMAEPSFSRSSRFQMRVESPTKTTDFISKIETRDVAEVADKPTKEPVDSLNVRLFASLSRSRSRENSTRIRAVAAPLGSLHSEKITPIHGKGSIFITPDVRRVFEENTVKAAPLFPPVKPTFHKNKRDTKHCFLCRKRTNLATSFECRCGNNFCATHRYAETHNCTYDYKTAGRRHLQEANPVITAPKLPKI